jgi:starch-binding outer membrane protein, SusD/RagB family
MKKNIIYISICSVLAVVSVSCKKYLDTKPQDVIVPSQYYSSESEINAAIGGIYSSLAQDGTFGRNIPIELDMATDEAQYNNRNNNTLVPALYDCQASTKIYSDCWSALYRGINAANMLLESINNSPVSDAVKNLAKGEATFIRGFNYFQLVTRFGDVPLVLKATTEVSNSNYPRTPSIQVYKQILDDMKAAEPLVKEITAIGNGSHITKTAIQGIIARVYLKMAGRPLNLGLPMYDSARVWAKKVVNSNIHSLNPNYRQIFINHSKDLYDYRESMFEIEFYGNNTPTGTLPPGSRFACQLAMRYTGADVNPLIVYGYGSYIPAGTLYDIYQKLPNDTLRRNWNIPTFTYSTNTTPRSTTPAAASPWDRDCGKWKRDEETFIPKSRDWGPTNFPVLRYADVLLMLSEAEMEMGNLTDARLYLNQVRARAQANLVTDAMSPDQATLRGIIHDERARELCFEGLRKFDLIRWGEFYNAMMIAKAGINASTSANKARYLAAYNNFTLRDTLLPIPSSEISVNNQMTQNAGW